MAAGNVSDLVRLQCPGAPVNLVSAVIIRAAREFFSDTEVWEKTLDFNTVADQAEYDLADELDELGEVRRVLEVTIDDTTVDANLYEMKGQTLVFEDAPDDVYDLSVKVVVVSSPMIDLATVSPDLVASLSEASDLHLVPVSEYALFLLRSMEGTPWFSDAMAQKHFARYLSEVGRVNAKRFMRGTGANQTAICGDFV